MAAKEDKPRKIWELRHAELSGGKLTDILAQGYKPFAAEGSTVWLRRKVRAPKPKPEKDKP